MDSRRGTKRISGLSESAVVQDRPQQKKSAQPKLRRDQAASNKATAKPLARCQYGIVGHRLIAYCLNPSCRHEAHQQGRLISADLSVQSSRNAAVNRLCPSTAVAASCGRVA